MDTFHFRFLALLPCFLSIWILSLHHLPLFSLFASLDSGHCFCYQCCWYFSHGLNVKFGTAAGTQKEEEKQVLKQDLMEGTTDEEWND